MSDWYLIMIDCFLGLLLVIVGSVITIVSIVTGFSWYSARSWPRVQAQLKSSAIERRRNPLGSTLVVEEFRPALRYEYQFLGKIYEGRRITFWDRRLWHDERNMAEQRIGVLGERFFVSVSPTRPHKSVIEYQLKRREWDLLGVFMFSGALVTGVGVWVMWMICLFPN